MTTIRTIVMVEWRDAARYDDSAWKGEDDEYDLIPMTTFGVLVKETDEYIVTAQDLSGGRPFTPYRGVMIIPKVNVVKIHRIQQKAVFSS